MFCGNCGSKLEDGAVSCPICGKAVSPEAPQGTGPVPAAPQQGPAPGPIPAVPQQGPAAGGGGNGPSVPVNPAPIPEGGKKSGRMGLIIGGIVGGLAVIALAVFLILHFAGGAKGNLGKAMLKSKEAYASAISGWKLPDMQKISKEQKTSQSFTLELEELSEYYQLEGLGISGGSNVDVGGKHMDANLKLYYGSVDLATFLMSLDKTKLLVSSPEFLESTVVGLDTLTLGKDLENLGAYGGVEDLSFDLFALAEKLRTEPAELDDALMKDLWDAVTVEKGEKTDMDINGTTLSCAAYTVTVPQDALEAWLDGVMDAVEEQDPTEQMVEALEETGLPDEAVSGIEDGMKESLRQQKQAFKDVENALDELGDLELEVYVNGGYVSAVAWEGRLDGTRCKATLAMGGGKEYVDNLSLTVKAGDDTIALTSEGSHTGAGGTYTDETKMTVRSDGERTTVFKSKLSYSPKGKDDNFSWELSLLPGDEDIDLKAKGSLVTSSSTLELALEELEMSDGYNDTTVSLRYSLSPYKAGGAISGKTVMLSDMDEDDLLNLVEDVEDNAYDWVYDMMDEIDDLEDLLYYFYDWVYDMMDEIDGLEDLLYYFW